MTRFGRGVSVGRGALGGRDFATPLSILGSLAWWVRADLGITIATGVSQWNDLSGNGVNFTQGTSGLQPTFVTSAINGQPAVRGDGIDDRLDATFARSAPSTQPFYVWVIAKTISFASSDALIGDFVSHGFLIRQTTPSASVVMYNSVLANANGGFTIGSYSRLETAFTNSTSDYLKVGSTEVTGTSSGVAVGGGTLQLFSRGDSAGGFGNFEIAEAFLFLGTPDAGQRAALDAYCTNRYGSGLV